tara:strand:- start:184 stop:291 length:108 start_codon:yes stop_codon:yes gene_type:complete
VEKVEKMKKIRKWKNENILLLNMVSNKNKKKIFKN